MVLPSAEEAFKKLQQGNRVFLSQMISTAESSLPDHRRFTSSLLELCSRQKAISRRIGITGVPGVGKSTFINVFGGLLTSKGSKVAVLAIDPSSNRSGGSILGDKVRMTELAADENAYIRPSPTSGYLGGVNAGTRSAIILCEAAGFDTILVETVGVGQSETQIETMVDFILLLMLPGAGDEMQGIKRGIMEVADHIAINQSEKDSEKKAQATRQHYESALHLFSARLDGWKTRVSLLSSIEKNGLDAILEQVEKYFREQQLSGSLDRKRMQQEIHAFYGLLKDQLLGNLMMEESLKKAIDLFEEKIRLHEINAPAAAIQLAMQIKTTFSPPA